MKLSFVIPCYNSSKTILSVVEEIKKEVEARSEYEYEIVLVNDCSKDNTGSIIRELALKNRHIKSVSLATNAGQHGALITGFNFVTGDYIFTCDDDGQTPLNRIYDLLDKLIKDDFDVVCAKYVQRNQSSALRRIGSKLNEKMSDWIIPKPSGVYMSAYLCARKFVTDEIVKYRNPYPYLSGLILRTTQNIGNVETEQRKREVGSSNYTISKLIKLWLNGFTAFSLKPLRISVFVGCFELILSFALLISSIIMLIVGLDASLCLLVAAVSFFFGIAMVFLGLIGEYIGRMYMCINNSPQFVIREAVNIEKENEKI